MLISFSVENFRSIKDEIRLSMRPDPATKEHSEYLISVDGDKGTLLPVASIYGNNGSGKSTILKAMSFMRDLVLSSAKNFSDGDLIPVEPFAFDITSESRPTIMAIEFYVDEVRYLYKFSVTAQRVTEELLHAYPKNTKQVWFERRWSEAEHKYEYRWSHNYLGGKLSMAALTLENTLYFSKAVMNNDEQLKPLNNFFREKLSVSYNAQTPHATSAYMSTHEGQKKILSFFRAADLGIDDLSVDSDDEDTPPAPKGLYRPQRKSLAYSTMAHHDVPNAHWSIAFPMAEESAGTIRMFHMAGHILNALSVGGVLFVDEIELGLHFKLQAFLVELFNDPVNNRNKAQLIFTTHSPLLLDLEFLRRDQVWFAAKTEMKFTKLYNLVDVPQHMPNQKAVRKDHSLVRGFVTARFYEPPNVDAKQLKLFE